MKSHHCDGVLTLLVALLAAFATGNCIARGLYGAGGAFSLLSVFSAALAVAFFMDATERVAEWLHRVKLEVWQPLPPFR